MCSQLEKTSNKLKINHDCCNTSYTFTNDKIAADIKAEILNDNGWKIDVGLAGERKEADKKYKITGTMDVKNKDLAGAKLCMNVSNQSMHIFILFDQLFANPSVHLNEYRLPLRLMKSRPSLLSPKSTLRLLMSSTQASLARLT